MFAEMCAMKIAALCRQSLDDGFTHPNLAVYCDAAVIYVTHTLSMVSTSPHQLLFNQTSALLVVSAVVRSLSLLRERVAETLLASF